MKRYSLVKGVYGDQKGDFREACRYPTHGDFHGVYGFEQGGSLKVSRVEV